MTENDWSEEAYAERAKRVEIDWGLEYEPEPEEVDPYKYVLGMDPGGTTGVALLRYTDDTLPELIYLHQIKDNHEGFLKFFDGSLVQENLDYVSEKWVEHGTKGVDREPLVIEGVQYALWLDNVTYQTPDMKSLVPDEWLKEQNLWTPGKRHQMDALIHALVFLRNNNHKPTQKALSDEAERKIAEEGEAESKELDESQEAAPGKPDEADGESGEGEGEGEGEQVEVQVAGGGSEPGDEVSFEEGHGGQSAPTTEFDLGSGWKQPEPKGTRKRRERNGVFAGYETETEGVEVELYVD